MRTYYPKFLSKSVYRRVLQAAQTYREDKRAIKAIECECILATSTHSGGGHSTSVSSPVQSIAERIAKYTYTLRQRTDAVEHVLSVFPDNEQKFIIQNIIDNTPITQCGMRDCERTLQGIRHDFLVLLAYELGEII